MLAVALNNKGVTEEAKIESAFIELFKDFKVIKISYADDLPKDHLELCQPVEYKELVKDIQADWDASETFLQLHGLKDKVQRAVRQMFFFDKEKNFEKVLLEGCEGMADYPWALQIVIAELPGTELEPDPEWIGQTDILIINNLDDKASRAFVEKVKNIRPNLPVFFENISTGLSLELKNNLQLLFADYLDKRQKIKSVLEEKYPQRLIQCEQARRMAHKLRVSVFLFGNVCDECGYRITHCGLGCF